MYTVSHFDRKIQAVKVAAKLRNRRKMCFLGPQFVAEGDTQHFTHAFSNRTFPNMWPFLD